MIFDYDKWAAQYADTLKQWGFIESLVDGWTADLLECKKDADVSLAVIALRKLQAQTKETI